MDIGYYLRPLAWAIFGYENYVKYRFKQKHGYKLDLKDPKSLSEKIQWIKVHGCIERFSKYVDKYAVRTFIKEKVGDEFLIPLIGIYQKSSEIDFNSLPASFVIKATHGSNWNIIVKDKTALNWNAAEKKMKAWLKTSFYRGTGEPNYKPLKGRILIEKYMEDPSGDFKDYKFFCFHGEPTYVMMDSNIFMDHRRAFYDLNWNKLPVKLKYDNLLQPLAKPEKLDDMIEICRRLSEPFAFVRVDLYCIGGLIYCGELTFTPGNGMVIFDPVQFDYVLGGHLDLKYY